MTELDLEAGRTWLERWERQQAILVEAREARFDAMLALVEAHRVSSSEAVAAYHVLDLGCGPGSLARRLAERVTGASVTAVDADPVLLALGKSALGGRSDITFVDSDLRDADWLQALGSGSRRFNTIASTTALHWLSPSDLVRLYTEIRSLLAPGGLFLNGDYFVLHRSPRLRRINDRAGAIALAAAKDRDPDAMDWDGWWSGLAAGVPALQEQLQERSRRYGDYGLGDRDTFAEFHLGALLEAGFAEAEVLWRSHTSSIIGAVTPDA